MTNEETLRLALEALKGTPPSGVWTDRLVERHERAIKTLEEALAKQKQGDLHVAPIDIIKECVDETLKNVHEQKQGEPVRREQKQFMDEDVLYTTPQPKQEQGAPVAWRHDMGEENGGWEYFEEASCPDCQPLYTTPPQRKPWVSMTVEQLDKAGMKLAECMDYPWEHMPEEGKRNMREHAKAIIEAAHGIKE